MGNETSFEGWAILELMGHRRLAGYVREQELAGGAFLRIDVPATVEPDGDRAGDPPLADDVVATQFYSASAIYCVTPTTYATARLVAAQARPQPVHEWELRRKPALTAARDERVDDVDDGEAF